MIDPAELEDFIRLYAEVLTEQEDFIRQNEEVLTELEDFYWSHLGEIRETPNN